MIFSAQGAQNHFGLMDGSPPGLPGGGITGIGALLSDGLRVISGSTLPGGRITPSFGLGSSLLASSGDLVVFSWMGGSTFLGIALSEEFCAIPGAAAEIRAAATAGSQTADGLNSRVWFFGSIGFRFRA